MLARLDVGEGRLLVALARAAPHDWIVPDSSLRTDINIALKQVNYMHVVQCLVT